jgi:hypothetical protein
MSFTTPDVPVPDDESAEFQAHLAEFLETNAPEDGAPVGTALGSEEDTSPQIPAPEPTEVEGDGSPGSPQESEEGGVASSPGSTPPPPPPVEEEGDSINFQIGDETEIITEDGTPAPPAADATDDPPAPTPAVDFERIFNAYFPGVEVTADNIVELLDFGTRVQSLSPERQRILNAAFMDDPAAYLGDLMPRPAAPTPPPAQVRQQQQPVDPWADPEDLPPAGPDPHVAQLEARLAQMEAQAQQAAIAQQEAQIQYETQLAGEGYMAFREQYPSLDETDLAILKAEVTKKGLYPALLRANNGDPRAAYASALETAMVTNPVYKDHAIRAATPASEAPPTPEEETRATLASAVSGSTSSPLSKVGAPRVAESDSEMKDQINAELKRVLEAQQ